MTDCDDSLLPLFLAEARDRLDRLAGLLEGACDDEGCLIRARRELHALKGASRMMGMGEFSALCHRGEELLEDPGPDAIREAVVVHDRLMDLLVSPEAAPADRASSIAGAESIPAAVPSGLPDDVLDGLADRGARLRVLAVGAAGLVDRVFHLARLAERGVGEPEPRQVLARLATSLRQIGVEFESGQRRMRRISEALLDTLLREQVQPLRPVLTRLGRHARRLADDLGKEVEVAVGGGDAVLDRRITRALQEAFLHIVRNAVDHGIEAPEERLAREKPRAGQISLDARSEGDRVLIIVRDDGRGIDIGAVTEAAIERRYLVREEMVSLTSDELLQLLFLPGLTTRDDVSELSGRGIGLDAVAATVRGLGGDIWLASRPGDGTTVSVQVPVTRRGERVLIVEVGHCQVALPAAPVKGFRRLDPSTLTRAGNRIVIRCGGVTGRVRILSNLIGGPVPDAGVVVEGSVAGGQVAVVADAVVGEEEVFIRPAIEGIGMPTLFDGIAVLASGRPVAVLSWQRLAPLHGSGFEPAHGIQAVRAVRVLLVDDSRVTREMIRQLLEDAGFAVTSVSTADEALERLGQSEFDCVVTDIEMPGMDGLALTRRLRSEARLADLPVIVVSTRDRPSDHRAGLDAGADAYLSKQSLEARELISLIRRVGGG
jgi:chemotaxis protein histidine kinase CheA